MELSLRGASQWGQEVLADLRTELWVWQTEMGPQKGPGSPEGGVSIQEALQELVSDPTGDAT